MAKLTTHVLDTASGRPAQGIRIQLYKLEPERIFLLETETNKDGRTDQPLISENEFEVGTYELVFIVGEYLRTAGYVLSNPPFLNEIPIRFSLVSDGRSYHVPLLLSPFGYSTYRGS